MVKIKMKKGEYEKWHKEDLERVLLTAGLSETLARVVAERVESKIVDGWTIDQVNEEAAVEIKRLKEDIERAYDKFLENAGIKEKMLQAEKCVSKEEVVIRKEPVETSREVSKTEFEAKSN